jgi:hypothetical protein
METPARRATVTTVGREALRRRLAVNVFTAAGRGYAVRWRVVKGGDSVTTSRSTIVSMPSATVSRPRLAAKAAIGLDAMRMPRWSTTSRESVCSTHPLS